MKKFSVLGDSISTYEGYNPKDYLVFYDCDNAKSFGLKSVKDTWWWQVIESLNGQLEINDSFSGSLISGDYPYSGNNVSRCQNLGEPDSVLIFMGFNDRGYKIPIRIDEGENVNGFFGGYKLTLKRIKEKYPNAKVYCLSLLDAHIIGGENVPISQKFIEETRAYNEAIEKSAKEEGCIYVNTFDFGKSYESGDFCHPTAKGHKQIASLVVEAIKNLKL